MTLESSARNRSLKALTETILISIIIQISNQRRQRI